MPHSAMVVIFARPATVFSVLNMAMMPLLSFLARVVCSIKPARNDPVRKETPLLKHGKSTDATLARRRSHHAPKTVKKRYNKR